MSDEHNRRRRVPRNGTEHKRRSTNVPAPTPRMLPEEVRELIRGNSEIKERRRAMLVVIHEITDAFRQIGATFLEIAEVCEGEAARHRSMHEVRKLVERRMKARDGK